MLARKAPSVAAAVVFGCIALGGVSLSASAENVERSEPASVLVQALDHVGDRVIKTGEFRYSLSAVTQPPTKEMIAERVEAIRQHLLITIEKFAGNEKAQRSLQRSLETIEEETARHMMESVSTTTNLFFVLGGPKLGSDRYVEYSTVDRESGRSGPASVVLQRSLGPSDGLVIYLEGAVGDAVANRRLMSPAGQEPQHLGRLTGALAETASLPSFNLQDSVSDVEVSVPEGEQDSDLRQVSCQLNRVVGFDARKFGVVAVRFHVDPSRGFVTPLVQELDIADNVVREWISSDYFQPRGTKLWFPKVCVYREGPAEAPMRTERYEFSPDGVVLNVDIPAERFAVTLNPGRVIADARDSDGSNANYIAQREVQISLDDLDHLAEMEAFNHFVPKTAPKRASPLSYWLIAANVLVVCALLMRVVRRRRSQLAAALSLALVATSLSGCERVVARSAPSTAAPLHVVPAQIELGEIAADGRTVDTSVRVENGDAQPVQVQIRASCGCTTLDSDRFLLAPGEHRDVALMLHTRGRSGESRASLRIVASPADSEAMLQEVLVPVNARFHDAWRCQPNRVYLSVDASGAAGGSCSVAGPADTWSEIEVDAGDSGIEVTVSSSETDGLIETRNIQVSARGVSDGNYALSLRRRDQQQPFLVIPLLVRSSQWLSDNATPQPGFEQNP